MGEKPFDPDWPKDEPYVAHLAEATNAMAGPAGGEP